MKTVADFGKLIKSENPGAYDDLSDAEVGMLARAEYPEDYLEFMKEDDALEYDEDMSENIETLISYYNPRRGRLSSWWQRGKAEGRTKLLRALNDEQALVIEQGAMLEKAVLEGRKHRSEVELFVRKNEHILFQIQAQEQLIESALNEGMDVAHHQDYVLAEKLSGLKIREHRQLKEIDLEVRWKEILQDSNAADLAQIGDHLVTKKLRQELQAARRERHAIRNGDEPEELKQELLADYDKFILRLEAKIDERETGHLLSENRPKARELAERASESRPEYPPETDEDSE